MSAATRQQQIEAGLRAVHTEGQGALSLIVVTPETCGATELAATNGDATAALIINATRRLLQQVHDHGTRRTALLCTLCDSPLWRGAPPHALAVLLPFGVDAPHDVVGMTFCADCAVDRSDRELGMAVVVKLRAWLPDLRVMSVMAQAGHA